MDVPEMYLNVLSVASKANDLPDDVHDAADKEKKHSKAPAPRKPKMDQDENVYLESSEEEGEDGTQNMTRAAQKALDREIPWRMIAPSERAEFVTAVKKE